METPKPTYLVVEPAHGKKKGFDSEAFYAALAEVVKARKVTWRRVARETGVSSSALTHMAKGGGTDAPSLAALSAWAGLNPADFVETSVKRAEKQTRTFSSEPMTVISSLLRADPELLPEEAEVLEQIIRLAYHRFTQQRA